MTISEIITLVRRDLKDESSPYQWSDEELTRHISRALRELSERLPLPAKAILPTVASSWELDISSLTDRIMVQAVEYPLDQSPTSFQRFSLWGNALTILSGPEPDGSNCAIYYGTIHTIDADGSTLPSQYDDLVAIGACGYAAISWAAFSINKVNVGGKMTSEQYRTWGNERLVIFRERLKQLGRRQRLRNQQLFTE
jgi:hypothetical protein